MRSRGRLMEDKKIATKKSGKELSTASPEPVRRAMMAPNPPNPKATSTVSKTSKSIPGKPDFTSTPARRPTVRKTQPWTRPKATTPESIPPSSAARGATSAGEKTRSRLLGPFFVLGALQGTPGLGEEDVVQSRLVEPEVGDFEPLVVERPHYVGQVAVVEPDRDGAGLGGGLLAEGRKDPGDGVTVRRSGGGGLDAGASNLGLKSLGRVLGNDPAAVY